MIMQSIPEKYHDLLADSTRAFAFLATLMPDGSPQVTPVWFNTDGEYLLVNSAAGRVKDQNMRERPQVAVTLMDLKNAYRYVQIRGEVVEITTEGAKDHIDALARKYTKEKDYVFGRPGEVRVIYKIKPLSIDLH